MLYIMTSHRFDIFHGMVINEYDEARTCLRLSDAQELMKSEVNNCLVSLFEDGIWHIKVDFSPHRVTVQSFDKESDSHFTWSIHEDMDKDAE